ncbi:MAG TPA: hypothetical protein VI391_08370 [Thermoanaerobaculia bacterium]
MKRLLPLLFALALPLQAADAIYESAAGHDCFVKLLKESGWGLGGPYERAAFVVVNNDGTYGCIEWPNLHVYQAEGFYGTVPSNAVAIVHTHPVQFVRPSPHDDEEATHLDLPIYTLTIRGVYKSIPGEPAVMITDKQSWINNKRPLTAGLRPDRLPADVNSNGVSNK